MGDKRIRLSCRDSSFPTLSLGTALGVIADLGLDGADISISDRHQQTNPEAVLEDPVREAVKVGRKLKATSLVVADCFALTGFGPNTLKVNAPDDAERRTARTQFEAFLRFATYLGAPGITVLPGMGDDSRALELAASELRWRQSIASDAGLVLSIEPHQSSVVKTPDDVIDLVECVPGLMLTLDYSHFVAAGIDDREVDVLLPHTRHLQARQASPGKLQTVFEEGTIDFSRVLGLLDESGYAGWIGFEYVWNSWTRQEVDTLGQTTLLRDHIRAIAAGDWTPSPR